MEFQSVDLDQSINQSHCLAQQSSKKIFVTQNNIRIDRKKTPFLVLRNMTKNAGI